MVKLVLFDIDGTLIYTGGAGVKAFGKVFETEFNTIDGLHGMRFAGRTDVSLVREFFRMHSIPETEHNFSRFFDRYVFWLEEILHELNKTVACPGVLALLQGLKALPQPPVLGLLTGNIRLGAEIKLRHAKLWQEFQTGGFADDSEERDCIAAVARQRACDILKQNLAPDEVVVIGDTPHDVRCGKSIGAKVLAVATGGATLDELAACKPDWLLENLDKIIPAELVL